jgi:hypothetical protein
MQDAACFDIIIPPSVVPLMITHLMDASHWNMFFSKMA